MKKSHKPELPWEPWDGEYMGNIWGWKFSFISLAILVILLLMIGYRYLTLEPKVFPDVKEPTEIITAPNSEN